MGQKSWKWIEAYEKARKKYDIDKSKKIANKTIKRRRLIRRSNYNSIYPRINLGW
jgi:hypothetical protein